MTAQSIAIASDVQTNVRMEKEGTYFEQLVRKKEMRTILGSYVMMLPYCEDIQIITEMELVIPVTIQKICMSWSNPIGSVSGKIKMKVWGIPESMIITMNRDRLMSR